MAFLSKLLSVGKGKQLRAFNGVVSKVNSFEPAMKKRSDEELRALTPEYKQRIENGEPLDKLLPEAFATVREASRRTLGLRHFDVQLIGGMALNAGMIAEMKTGEGKTLVSTLPGYLNALTGKNVHIVTVNDYLAKRDSTQMGRIYKFLGMDVGLIQSGMDPVRKKEAYKANVTYGTNSEFGFDYLRDNMVTRANDRVQRGHHFCVVDEVDSILIDEARTPLIISGAGVQAADTYKKFARVMPSLVEGVDFEKDEAKKTINCTDSGLVKVEEMLGIDDLYSDPSGMLPNYLQQALRAQFLYHRDIDYIVADNQVKIVDEFTGRIMEGRRWSDGLHQAIEAKEHVPIKQENQTLATITLQNYFRLYDKLSGMTGTALTEDSEFREIYKLPVMAVPTNKPLIRKDLTDLVYQTIDAKFNAVADDVKKRHDAGQPVLIGTVSVENSEKLSRLLDKRGIPHEVLNAKNHEHEAMIIAQAGRVGAVTIATNMAGRGTDILLGGNPDILVNDILSDEGVDPEEATDEQRDAAYSKAKDITDKEHKQVVKLGGLCVIGTERHESRRIDNQLRGRSGRQGDPGETQFYLSLEDDLMRLFGGDRMERVKAMMAKANLPEDMPIQSKMVTRAIENAQHQVETMNFAARKHVLEYDDVMNLQRKAIYKERNSILDGKSITDRLPDIMSDCIAPVVEEDCPERKPSDDWDKKALNTWVWQTVGSNDFDIDKIDHEDDPDIVKQSIDDYLMDVFTKKKDILGADVMETLEAQVLLRIIDTRWMVHLQAMDYLRQGIGLRAVGQRDPLVEYKNEAHKAFGRMVNAVYSSFIQTILRLQIAERQAPQIEEEQSPLAGHVNYNNPDESLPENAKSGNSLRESVAAAHEIGKGQAPQSQSQNAAEAAHPETKNSTRPYIKAEQDPYAGVGRNDPCPCGSGKKFKNCHGRNRF